MSVDIEGIDVGLMIEQVGDRVKRHAIDRMKREAEKIAQKARDYAPVDEGNLEKAIKVDTTGGGRNELGQFQRKSVVIYVDGEMSVPERPGKTVGDYAYIQHEHLEPNGPNKLGDKSRTKDGGQGKVGGGFMTRAMKDTEMAFLAAIAAEIKDVLDVRG